MGKIILYAILLCGGTAALIRPWIGMTLAYLLIILTPQSIWWWSFQGVRPVYWILIPTLIGFVVALARGHINLEPIKNRRNLYLLVLWICFVMSYFFGPYIGVQSNYWFRDPKQTFLLVDKIFILYFISAICINDEKKLKYLILVMVISVIYFTYWANAQYLIEHRHGRIGGPTGIGGGSIYQDDNAFAMLFVTGLPFLYYLGYYFKKKILRYALWLVIPFGWHAIFLTGSRGGLIGAGATIVLAAFRSPRKFMGLAVIPFFVIAYLWQAGPVMKQRARTIAEYQEESSAEGRINAWKAAIEMVQSHPFLGVGLASFGPAFSDFSDKAPRETHNTYFQIAAESGLLAGLVYLLLI